MNKDCIVLHIPHSSLLIPQEALVNYNEKLLEKEFLLMTDRYTDELFNLELTSIVFPYSRLFCDIERFRDDDKEEMSKKGMGAVYTKTHDGISFRAVTAEDKNKILKDYYDVHHKKFDELVSKKLEQYNEALIIDCHSFNPYPLPHENDRTDRPDICIGTDDFHTPDELTEYFTSEFAKRNYRVKINSPFCGSIVPLKYYRKNRNVKSIMIELNRSLYMDKTGKKTEGFAALKKEVAEIILGF